MLDVQINKSSEFCIARATGTETRSCAGSPAGQESPPAPDDMAGTKVQALKGAQVLPAQ